MPLVRAHVFHVNVNCSNLETSVAFYRDAVGLQPLVRTTPDRPQPGDAFGLELAHWDAWIMAGDYGLEGVVVDLLEWKTPRPAEASADGGFRELRIAVGPGAGLAPGPSVDPDGTRLDVVTGHDARVVGIVIGCSDRAESEAFYVDVVGLSPVGASTFSDDRGPEVFTIELVDGPRPHRPRAANDLGIYRLALLSNDFDQDYDTLVAAGVRPYSPPATLDMGPDLPALRAVFFPDPDGTTLELIEQPDVGTAPS